MMTVGMAWGPRMLVSKSDQAEWRRDYHLSDAGAKVGSVFSAQSLLMT